MLFLHSALADRYTYYLFYIPFIALPMLSLSAAVYVSRDEDAAMPLYSKALWGVAGSLMLCVLTNDIHQFHNALRDLFMTLAYADIVGSYHQTDVSWLYVVQFAVLYAPQHVFYAVPTKSHVRHF